MNKKKIMSVVLLTTMLGWGTLAGCGNTSTKDAAHDETAKEVTINFWHHYSEQSAENATLNDVLIPQFEKENPGIKVNAVSHEWADLHDKILISAKSNTLPDVARLDSAWIPEFEKGEMLVALDEEMTDYKEVAGNLLESAMTTAKVKEHTYGLALNTNTKILFYNKKMFEDANLSAPKTMEEFVSVCKQLSGKNENGQQIWGYNEPGLSGWNLCPFIWSYGGAITNENQTKATGYLNSKETVEAIDMIANLYKEKLITGWNSGDIPMTDGFGTGRYAMIVDGPWKISELLGGYPDFSYGMLPFPSGKAGSYSVLGGEDIAMLNIEHKEAAWKFMKFMTDEFAQTEMAKCGQIPVNKVALESDTVKEAEFAPYIEALKTAKSRPTVAAWSEIDSELSVAVGQVVNGEKTAQEAMDLLAVKVDKLLAE